MRIAYLAVPRLVLATIRLKRMLALRSDNTERARPNLTKAQMICITLGNDQQFGR